MEKETATHSSVLAWRIPGTGEPDGLPSMGSHRVGCGHDSLGVPGLLGVLQTAVPGGERSVTPILAHTPATLPAPDPLPVRPQLVLLFLLSPQHPGAGGGKKTDVSLELRHRTLS